MMKYFSDKEAYIEKLEAFGALPDDDIPLYEAALYLAALRHQGLSLDRYKNHVKKLAGAVKSEHERLLAAGDEDKLETRLAALKTIMVYEYEYQGDTENYDDLENADIVRVIDRRKGMPITLSILYMEVSNTIGWDTYGLNWPGHFIVRMDKEGQRLMFDPFDGCKILQAPELRQLLKKALGDSAELSSAYYEAAASREILLRLQNNIKIRQIETEDYQGALETVQILKMIAPHEYRLQLDAGVLYARTGQVEAAIVALEDYIEQAPADKDRHDAALLLQHIKHTIGADLD
jgi:regulator of sirC expression with transglutaminase-like and TPR domain